MDNNLFIELRDLAYKQARDKGFFAGDQPEESYITAIHEELSEAFKVLNKSKVKDIVDAPWIVYIPTGGLNKPDGIYFELTDAVIRLLSYCGFMGYEQVEPDDPFETDRPYDRDDFWQVINASHSTLAYMNSINVDFDADEIEESIRCQGHLNKQTADELVKRKLAVTIERNNELRGVAIKEFIERIERFIEDSSKTEIDGVEHSLDLYDLIIEKLKYNASRPQKHGGNMV